MRLTRAVTPLCSRPVQFEVLATNSLGEATTASLADLMASCSFALTKHFGASVILESDAAKGLARRRLRVARRAKRQSGSPSSKMAPAYQAVPSNRVGLSIFSCRWLRILALSGCSG